MPEHGAQPVGWPLLYETAPAYPGAQVHVLPFALGVNPAPEHGAQPLSTPLPFQVGLPEKPPAQRQVLPARL